MRDSSSTTSPQSAVTSLPTALLTMTFAKLSSASLDRLRLMSRRLSSACFSAFPTSLSKP